MFKLKLVILLFFVWLVRTVVWSWPDHYAHIIFCDVGQGDAILITQGSKQILIDGGPDEKVLSCLDQHLPFWDKSIDFLVVTHLDSDHIGGLPAVLKRYQIGVVLMNTTSTKKTAVFNTLEQILLRKKNQSPVISTYIGQQIKLSSLIHFIVISPQVQWEAVAGENEAKTETTLSATRTKLVPKLTVAESENDSSIVLFGLVGQIRLMLTGDMEKAGELAVMKAGMTEEIDILKAGHHGSKSSSSWQFINLLRPETVVFSSGKNNQYHHPSSQVLDIFTEFDTKIWRTDTQGTIEFVSDGTKYWRAI